MEGCELEPYGEGQFSQVETGGEGLIVSMKNALLAQLWQHTHDTETVKGDQQYAFITMGGDKFIMLSLGLAV